MPEPPTAGMIRVLGRLPGDPAVLRQAGAMGEIAFYPFLSGRDNLRAARPAGAGSAIGGWTWCSGRWDWPNEPGMPWLATATGCGSDSADRTRFSETGPDSLTPNDVSLCQRSDASHVIRHFYLT